MIGVLNMSGPSEETHQHTLWMLVSSVAAIMFQMRIQSQNQELKNINERMRNVFVSMSDGVIILEKNGRIVQINPVAENLLGKNTQEMAGK